MPILAAPRVQYRRLDGGVAMPADTLAAISFGSEAPPVGNCLSMNVGLKPLRGAGLTEIWRGSGAAEHGSHGMIRYAADRDYLAGVIEIDEREFGGIGPTAEAAYRQLREFHGASSHPHLLRMWNYFDDINQGEGDSERYRQFCVGRSAGLGGGWATGFPAATAVGRRNAGRTLQICWLAGRSPGLAVENPRQVSAYSYPRQYGPAAPSFSRAMLVPGGRFMVSGTASIVGHASGHCGNIVAQLDETLENLRALFARAAQLATGVPNSLDTVSFFKIYLRNGALGPELEQLLHERLPAAATPLILEADICRAELLLEIECIQ
jgi:chorismate lyase/3-hydroxybenzoate synthase